MKRRTANIWTADNGSQLIVPYGAQNKFQSSCIISDDPEEFREMAAACTEVANFLQDRATEAKAKE